MYPNPLINANADYNADYAELIKRNKHVPQSIIQFPSMYPNPLFNSPA